jgi:hypothetical protein
LDCFVTMRLWRKQYSEDGKKSFLKEITTIKDIDTKKPLLFVFPGADATNSQDGHRVASGSINQVNMLLGTDPSRSDVETLIVTYDTSTSDFKRLFMNSAMDWYKDPDALQFVKHYLFELIQTQKSDEPKNRSSITFYAISHGAVYADNVRICLVSVAKRKGWKSADIKEALENITLVTIVNLSRSTDMYAPRRNSAYDYSSVFIAVYNDLKASCNNPLGYHNSIPPKHEQGQMSISYLGGNRIQLLVDAPAQGLHIPKDVKVDLLKDKSISNYATDVFVPNVVGASGVCANHDPRFIIYGEKISDLLGNALRNSVRRTQKVPVLQLIQAYGMPLVSDSRIERYNAWRTEYMSSLVEDALTRGELVPRPFNIFPLPLPLRQTIKGKLEREIQQKVLTPIGNTPTKISALFGKYRQWVMAHSRMLWQNPLSRKRVWTPPEVP